jgi:hypothetical protein
MTLAVRIMVVVALPFVVLLLKATACLEMKDNRQIVAALYLVNVQ